MVLEDVSLDSDEEGDHKGATASDGKVPGAESSAGRAKTEAGRQTTEEGLGRGAVSLAVFKEYAKSLGGWPSVSSLMFLFALYQGSSVVTNWWLSYWSSETAGDAGSDDDAGSAGGYGAESWIDAPTAHGSENASMSMLWTPSSPAARALHGTWWAATALAGSDAQSSSSRLSPALAGLQASLGAADTTADNRYFLNVYAAISMSTVVVMIVLRAMLAEVNIRSARVMHEGLLTTILRTYQSFFDTTPTGRILNRFSQDTYTIDEQLLSNFSTLIQNIFSILGTIGVICTVTPPFLGAVVPLLLFYAFTQRYYVATSRELQRLESASRSPIYAHFSETLTGAVTIRAYADQNRFLRSNERRLELNRRSYFMSTSSNRWLAVRLEFVGSVFVCGSALFAVVARGTIDPALAGLSISYALSVTQTLNWMVRMLSSVETQIVSVERMREYSVLPTEPTTGTPAPAAWPAQGHIRFRNVKMKYREGTPYVLHGVSFDIRAGERIGIVGRTGAGKSSLLSVLFRLADVLEGEVLIDGVDIRAMPLAQLRSHIAIIPQEANLFSGPLRRNLDPLEQFSDEDILVALDRVSLRDAVESSPDGLQSVVAEGGENWSHGQRQLLCMARALLRQCRIVVLDEATAACDMETDALLQRTIREHFRGATVLTIAHRIHTILDSDRVMVLNRGRIAEFDSPQRLLADTSSAFSSLLRDSHASEGQDH